MATLLLLTSSADHNATTGEAVLPALALLTHRVVVLPPEATALIDAPSADATIVDGRTDLARARGLARLIRTTGVDMPLLLVVTEGGLSVVSDDWGMDDVLLADAGPAEVEARLRLAAGRLLAARGAGTEAHVISASGLQIDEGAYTAKLEGRTLDLTFKEFELVKFLAQHPGRVFTRQQLLQDVWGYDYFGGTRTVDVHVRRLRAKLGPDNEQLIGTVRNVGYRFVTRAGGPAAPASQPQPGREREAPQQEGREQAATR